MNLNKKIIIIAEVGVNHNGKLSLAKKLIKEAKNAGTDFVKFQIFQPNEITTKTNKKTKYQKKFGKKNETQLSMLKKYYLSNQQIKELQIYCRSIKVNFLASVFDLESLKTYEKLNPKIIKIPSGEITNKPLLEKISKLKINTILSTGMSSYKEICNAYKILKKSKKKVIPLYCISSYPTDLKEFSLKKMHMLKKINSIFGFSDHTLGNVAAMFAIFNGARVIEKHLTLNKKLNGPDHYASMEPKEFKNFIENIRDLELLLNNKKIVNNEIDNKKLVRKFLVAKTEILKGQYFTDDNITTKRSGGGISPMEISKILGLKSKKNYSPDDVIEK